MIKKKACVFVDSENFRFALADVLGFDRSNYLPRDADWAGFYDFLVDKATAGVAERLRTYWYVVRNLEFWPYKIGRPAIERDGAFYPNEGLKKTLCTHPPYRQILANEGITDEDVIDEMRDMAESLKSSKHKMQGVFEGWKNIQNGIAMRHRGIEFRRDGWITFDLFRREFVREKGVDVFLAVDLLALKDTYDVAIIVSGDQDYAPAVKAVKNFGKQVINVAFENGPNDVYPTGARWLNQVTDYNLVLDRESFRRYMFVDKYEKNGNRY